MTSEEYIALYQKYVAGKCNAEEVKLLFEHKDNFELLEVEEQEDIHLREKIHHRIQQTIAAEKPQLYRSWYKYAAAAVVFLAIGTYIGISVFKRHHPNIAETVSLKTDTPFIRMDSTTAVLTLADGSMIPLDETGNGLLTEEEGTEIRKIKSGELSYNTSKQLIGNTASINKISIPRGTTYKVTLADGTKVWLNAASSLSYPSSFSGAERRVELVGEAYFEVAKNEKMPFKVKTRNAEIEVLGTHFNVTAYANDNDVKTTLLEGSVKLLHMGNEKLLKPGYQAIIADGLPEIKLKQVNAELALAWRNGYFLFKENNIVEVMNQISRWYNVQVEYEGKTTDKLFGGIYSKSKKLEELLNGLELTGLVKFKIIEGVSLEERRVIVMD